MDNFCTEPGNICCDSSTSQLQCSIKNNGTCCTGLGYASNQEVDIDECCSDGKYCCLNVTFSAPMRKKINIQSLPGKVVLDSELQVGLHGKNVTSCADPDLEFCCLGVACPTETLCCGSGGCCFGFASKDYTCVNENNCPGPT